MRPWFIAALICPIVQGCANNAQPMDPQTRMMLLQMYSQQQKPYQVPVYQVLPTKAGVTNCRQITPDQVTCNSY